MFLPKQLDDLIKKLCAALPSNIHSLEADLHQQFKDILQSALMNLNLVTREEFDVQTKVLARTREKVDKLQLIVEQFNTDLDSK